MSANDKYRGPYNASGELAGTGAAIVVNDLGFFPMRVTIYNRTRLTQGVWCRSMPQDSAMLTVDSGAGTTDLSFITSNGITGNVNGFTLGSNASLNTASDTIYWVAEREARQFGG